MANNIKAEKTTWALCGNWPLFLAFLIGIIYSLKGTTLTQEGWYLSTMAARRPSESDVETDDMVDDSSQGSVTYLR